MNFVLFVHDQSVDGKFVWDPDIPGITEQVAREIGELVSDYTMGRVTVDLIDNAIPPPSGREDGHIFQVMCAGCLDETFDVADVMGACPEYVPDEEDDDR